MKIAFIQGDWRENHGLLCLSAIVKERGHTADVFISGESNFENKVCEFKPDIIGFTVTTGTHKWAVYMAERFKNRLGVPIILGGPHPTVCPEIIQEKNIDIICRGEGEFSLVELLNCLENSKDITQIRNLWIKQKDKIYKNELSPLISDLDSLPMPDWSIYHKYKHILNQKSKSFLASRGCPYSCNFCATPIYRELYANKGPYVRQRSVDSVLKEIKEEKRISTFEAVSFEDEIFVLNKKWLNDFLPKYKNEIGIPFLCGLRADLIDGTDLDLLKDCGCYGITFGIETGNEYLRKEVLGKHISNKAIIYAARSIKKAGIKLRTTNMFCIPGESLQNSFETVKINIQCKVDAPFAYIFQPLPKTKAFYYAIENNYLPKDFSFDSLDNLYINNTPVNLKDKNKILNLQKFFYLAVKHPSLLLLIKLLICFPYNMLYDLIFNLSLVRNYANYKKISFLESFMLGLRSLMLKIKFKKVC